MKQKVYSKFPTKTLQGPYWDIFHQFWQDGSILQFVTVRETKFMVHVINRTNNLNRLWWDYDDDRYFWDLTVYFWS